MDAIALLRELGPLARDFGWPAVFLVVFLTKIAPHLVAIARAHVRLIETLRETLPRSSRNQARQTEVLTALTAFLRERSDERKDRASPLAVL